MKKYNLLILFLVVFLDLVGVGILIPVLAPLMKDPTSLIAPMEWTEQTRNIALGLLIAAYPIAQFFGAPILGTLSDRFGRKKLLQASLFGTMLGYILFAYALLSHQLWLLYLSRALDGFTGGNIGVASSAIADMSTPQNRAKNFGLIGMAFGFGFIIGPFLGGVLSNSELVSWFNPTIPFWFAAGLSLLNLFLLTLLFEETLKEKVARAVHPLIGFTHLRKAWKLENLRTIFLVIFLHSLGFCFFTQFFPVFLVDKFHTSEAQIGTIFGYVGIWIAFAQGFFTRLISKRASPQKVLPYALLALSGTLFVITLPTNLNALYFIQPFMAIAEGLCFPNETAVLSNLCGPTEQGEALGITQSLRALGQAVPPLLAGFLVNIDQNLPTWTASGLILLAAIIFVIFFRSKPLKN
jgi:DHA1 family tetracycline resistance protein-like MFS transporter